MEKLGEYLKARREEKGLSLKDMADRTRISLTFLKALEDGDYSSIPGEVFVSGFLRSYARELGLKEKDVMARYRESTTPAQPAAPEAPSAMQEATQPGKRRAWPLSTLLLFAASAGIILVLIAHFIFGRVETEDNLSVAEPPVVKKAPEPSVATMAHDTSIATGEVQGPPAEAGTAVPEKKGVTLNIKARMETWYSLRADGVRKEAGTLKPGESLKLSADREILLDLGNAGGVDMEFNGKAVGPFGPPLAVRKNILFSKEKPGVLLGPSAVKPQRFGNRTT